MPIKTVDGWKTKAQIARQGSRSPRLAGCRDAEHRPTSRLVSGSWSVAEKAWKKARRHLVEKLGEANLTNETLIKQRALEVFADIDMDKNKSIDSAELKEAMKQMGVELKNKEIEDMMIEADADGCARTDCTRQRRSAIHVCDPHLCHGSDS
jgi:hypothetical protein